MTCTCSADTAHRLAEESAIRALNLHLCHEIGGSVGGRPHIGIRRNRVKGGSADQ